MFSALLEFGWNPFYEKGNIIGLNKGGKNITLEPGNQIELSGEKLKSYSWSLCRVTRLFIWVKTSYKKTKY